MNEIGDENDDFESPVVSELDTRVVKLNATLSRTQMQKRDKEQAIAELLREIDEIGARIRARERDEAAEEAKNAVGWGDYSPKSRRLRLDDCVPLVTAAPSSLPSGHRA